ncbi:unnamed protein product [Symbiodinium pilosum]|uniref:Ubiquitin-like domain-containing protein n=1 Tax=Symbiodinium pilosum TaxID=2952 RepID=A0A812X0G2_SYMPI|nr:unnamed protein product [Symbiodinium pilosum]
MTLQAGQEGDDRFKPAPEVAFGKAADFSRGLFKHVSANDALLRRILVLNVSRSPLKSDDLKMIFLAAPGLIRIDASRCSLEELPEADLFQSLRNLKARHEQQTEQQHDEDDFDNLTTKAQECGIVQRDNMAVSATNTSRVACASHASREGDPTVRSVVLAEKPSILAAWALVDHRMVTEPERLGPEWDVVSAVLSRSRFGARLLDPDSLDLKVQGPRRDVSFEEKDQFMVQLALQEIRFIENHYKSSSPTRCIQAVWRGFHVRQAVEQHKAQMVEAARKIQRGARRLLWRKHMAEYVKEYLGHIDELDLLLDAKAGDAAAPRLEVDRGSGKLQQAAASCVKVILISRFVCGVSLTKLLQPLGSEMKAIPVAVELKHSGECLQIDAPSSWTIGDLKARIQELSKVPPQQQRIVLGEVERDDFLHHRACLVDGEFLSGILTPAQSSLHFRLVPISDRQAGWQRRVAAQPRALEEAPENIQDDFFVVLEAVRHRGEALQFASERLRKDRALVRAAVQQSGAALLYAAAELRRDPSLVLELAKNRPGALASASEDLWKDPEFLRAAIALQPDMLSRAPEELKSDRGFLQEVLGSRGDALVALPEELRADKELVMVAVGQSGAALEHASHELREDREVVAVAVRNGAVLPESFNSDRELVLDAVRLDGLALELVSKELRDDEEVALTAVQQNGHALLWASRRLRSNRAFVLAAARWSHDVLQHVSVRLRTDATFMALLSSEDAEAVEPEMEDLICRGKHEEQILKRFLLNEIKKTLSESHDLPKTKRELRALEGVLEEEE